MTNDLKTKQFFVLVPKVAETVTKKMGINLAFASASKHHTGKRRDFDDAESDYILGYITALSDLLSQYCGAETGSSIVESVLVNSLQDLFGEAGVPLFNKVASYMVGSTTKPNEFDAGMTDGVSDANDFLNGKESLGIGRQFGNHFIK